MDPSEGKRMGMGPGCHGSSWRASPHPHPAPALPLSSPLWTEPPLSCCLPATYPADVGTAGAMQLCWVILGFLLFQGHNSQPATTQTSSSQGGLGSLSLTTEPVSSNPGYIPSSEANSPSHLSNTGTPGAGVPSSGRDGGTSRGVISFIVILVVVVIVLVGVVSLRFKCRKSKESEDPQKPGSSGLSESCSTANGEKDSITLISMKNINMNNGKQSLSAEKVL
ncbi:endothelial cell-specific chemotaxis regulator isoform X4 [Pongo abelii]|uniref:endothelial cell-specific chemotaxis regulator isoform X4 n=1 Tax=Pongo abelii TaxID=9601 RepID=UPI0023E8037A|nr:endothelial cell-specific chemotaxis regulator isoform X3 [Pongo abelii]